MHIFGHCFRLFLLQITDHAQEIRETVPFRTLSMWSTVFTNYKLLRKFKNCFLLVSMQRMCTKMLFPSPWMSKNLRQKFHWWSISPEFLFRCLWSYCEPSDSLCNTSESFRHAAPTLITRVLGVEIHIQDLFFVKNTCNYSLTLSCNLRQPSSIKFFICAFSAHGTT